jgi:lysophospholipase L1-like esterase
MPAALRLAPAPYPLRATAWFSDAASHLVLRLWALTPVSRDDSDLGSRRVAALFVAIAVRLEHERIDFIVTNIGLLGPKPDETVHYVPKTVLPLAPLVDRGIDVLVAHEALARGRDRAALAPLISRDGVHTGVAGHQAVADWLAPIILERLDARQRLDARND